MTAAARQPGAPEFMMPVPPEGAAMQFFVEAMKANTAALRGVQDEVGELRREVRDVRESVIRIEAVNVTGRVERLEREVDELKADKDKRDGAHGAANWLLKNLPTIGAILVAVFASIVLTLRASGRL